MAGAVLRTMMNRTLAPLLVVLAALPAVAESAPRDALPLARAKIELFADRAAVAPGDAFTLALKITLAPGWHTYWLNPGDTGMAPRVAADFSVGARPDALGFQWPAPRRFDDDGLVSYGYEGEVVALLSAKAAPDLTPGGAVVACTVAVELLFCHESCEPGSGELALSLPVESSTRIALSHAAEVARARNALPKQANASAAWHRVAGKELHLFVPAREAGAPLPDGADLYPLERGLVPTSARPEPAAAPGGYILRLPLSPSADAVPDPFRAVVVERRGETVESHAIEARRIGESREEP